jgi:CheY-like chemotaxis protein
VTARTVLVVDDDDEIREITQLALELLGGWDVLGADGGQAALEMVRRHGPDAVLLDVMMPGMDGPTTLGHLQADADLREVPVILLTAKVQVGQAQVWDGLPVAGVISKPFNPTTLADEISAILGWDAADPLPASPDGQRPA